MFLFLFKSFMLLLFLWLKLRARIIDFDHSIYIINLHSYRWISPSRCYRKRGTCFCRTLRHSRSGPETSISPTWSLRTAAESLRCVETLASHFVCKCWWCCLWLPKSFQYLTYRYHQHQVAKHNDAAADHALVFVQLRVVVRRAVFWHRQHSGSNNDKRQVAEHHVQVVGCAFEGSLKHRVHQTQTLDAEVRQPLRLRISQNDQGHARRKSSSNKRHVVCPSNRVWNVEFSVECIWVSASLVVFVFACDSESNHHGNAQDDNQRNSWRCQWHQCKRGRGVSLPDLVENVEQHEDKAFSETVDVDSEVEILEHIYSDSLHTFEFVAVAGLCTHVVKLCTSNVSIQHVVQQVQSCCACQPDKVKCVVVYETAWRISEIV